MPTTTPECANDADKRRSLGQLIHMLIRAGLDQKSGCEDWWSECERIHRNEWGAGSMDEGLVNLEVPYSQPRQDMLTAQVCSIISRQEPYMLAEDTGDSSEEESKERAVHKFWKSAGFESKVRRASYICTDTNKVWYRIAFEKVNSRPFGGLIWDVVHPRHVCIYPATVEGIQGARLVGHRFYRRVREIEAMQKSGVYFQDEGAPVIGGDTPQEYDTGGEIEASGAVPQVMGPDIKDQRVELWDVCVRVAESPLTPNPSPLKGRGAPEEKWYRATLAFKTMTLLSFESYPYSRPWYFDASFVTTSDDAYWSPVSVARHLSGLQDATNKYNATLYNGAMMTAFPPVFGPELSEKDFRISFGDYVPTDSAAQSWSPNITFRGEPIMQHLQMLDLAGDKAARISANTQGTLQARQTTATESSIIASDVSVGIEEYISNFGMPLGEIAEFTCELLAIHYADWQKEAASLGVRQADLLTPCLWEPNGKTPGNTPGAKLAAIEKLMGLAQAFGPLTGIDIYELTRVFIANSGLFGADNIQLPKEKLPQPGNPVAGGQPGPGALPPPGMGPPAALPESAPQPGRPPMPNP